MKETIKLNNGGSIPRVGLGVWQIENSKVNGVVAGAIKSGYRHIDTACVYKNELGVGEGIKQSGIKRKDVFVTTKLAVNDFYHAREAFLVSLKKLDMEYVDLYLIHRPFLFWKKAWKELEIICKSGAAKAIGVSNFSVKDIEALEKMGGVVPAVNQIELSPFLYRKDTIEYCQSRGMVVEAYSPLTRGKRMQEKAVLDMAKKYKKTSAQIMIRWGLQHNLVMLPKSENLEHIKSNIEVFDFDIDECDMKRLDSLNENFSALFPGWSRS